MYDERISVIDYKNMDKKTVTIVIR